METYSTAQAENPGLGSSSGGSKFYANQTSRIDIKCENSHRLQMIVMHILME